MFAPPWDGCVSIGGPSGEAGRAYYAQAGIALVTWSSLAGGFFSGRFRRDNLDQFTTGLDALCVKSYCYEANFQRLDRAQQMAKAKGLTLPEIALAYSRNHPLNLFSLVGCQTAEEFADNAKALDVTLTPEEVRWLEAGEQTPTAERTQDHE
jgi:aryl-alcohol dehydrogenase-like predicted oxidoreductase